MSAASPDGEVALNLLRRFALEAEGYGEVAYWNVEHIDRSNGTSDDFFSAEVHMASLSPEEADLLTRLAAAASAVNQ